MALIRTSGAGAGAATFTDISSSFTVQDSAGQYNRIAATTDLTEYDYVVLTIHTAATGTLTSDMTLDMNNISGNRVVGVAKNVTSGQYFGRGTGTGTTTSAYSAVGVKLG